MEDILVIGAGIIGSNAALNLVSKQYRVHIVDSDDPGLGCSFGNAGLIAVDHVAPLASPDTLSGIPRMLLQSHSPLKLHMRSLPRMAPWMLEFVAQSRPSSFRRNTVSLASMITVAAEAWQRLLARNIGSDLFRDIGSLYVFEKPVDAGAERKQLQLLDHYGVQYKNLTAAQVRAEYLPTLTSQISHARYFSGMASVTNPRDVVIRVFNAAINAGAGFTKAPVLDIQTLPDQRISVRLGDNTRVFDKVLIAAGAKSAELTARVGLRIPLTHERGYHVQLAKPSGQSIKVPVSFVERGFTCNPMRDGIRLAGTVELGPPKEPDWGRADILASQFGNLFPNERAPEVASRWFGDRPTLPDYLPMIDEVPGARNVFVATGHQHLGLTLGPLTGELVSQLMARETPSVDLHPFRADRF
ncbi:FAD-binding oxidoreductase (plasmid) [Burkholderia vietnamiensis]|uniref:D-amino-acid dehydrogenase n=1 Tax=Burkholderia vietnamiensis (strain G4 / LMG 22486) TaxID=269482 RepID=A4JTG3_BURVG|nr:D-amino-acid dehydrogenase [Burkholderia vietnamiensis G4]MCB4350281.1 FAD-binding oxidoreductase [Burkholderia vietnamiensis]